MSLEDDFKSFIGSLEPDNLNDMENTVKQIAKKLNKNYYDLENDGSSHVYIVGSIGRGTAIKGVSDLDIIFDLPTATYTKFNNYEENGQSQLLQEVKNILKEKYSSTDINGDGQVVSINFSKYTVELVPGFKQLDETFKYPDSNNGGSWKYTNPISEINESNKMSIETDNNFKYIANILRSWKNYQGFKFGGLLIDSLTYKFLNENTDYKKIEFDGYLDMSKTLFNFIKDLNKEQSYWYALGSNQKVYNCDSGKFITKASKVYSKIEYLKEDSINVNDALREIFGTKFPERETDENRNTLSSYNETVYRNTEEFIEDKFPVDIIYNLKIDCTVTQNGSRPFLLRNMLKNKKILKPKRKLEFFISEINIKKPYDIYWKVTNRGEEAIKRDCIRGQIVKCKESTIVENTNFKGEHFVECYIVKNGVCVAKNRLKVPISNYEYIMG